MLRQLAPAHVKMLPCIWRLRGVNLVRRSCYWPCSSAAICLKLCTMVLLQLRNLVSGSQAVLRRCVAWCTSVVLLRTCGNTVRFRNSRMVCLGGGGKSCATIAAPSSRAPEALVVGRSVGENTRQAQQKDQKRIEKEQEG